jgi:hypothetical protein
MDEGTSIIGAISKNYRLQAAMSLSSDLEDVTNTLVDEVLEGKSYYEAYEDVEDDLQTAM